MDKTVEWKVGDHVVELTHWKKFRIVGTETDYPSFEEAKRAAERITEAQKKVNRKKVSLACLQYSGDTRPPTECTVTGIHAGHRQLTGKGVQTRGWGSDRFYPDHQHVRGLINRCIAARKAVSLSEKELERFLVKHEVRNSSTPEDLLIIFERAHEAMMKKAEREGAK